jgi:hypothetical protein
MDPMKLAIAVIVVLLVLLLFNEQIFLVTSAIRVAIASVFLSDKPVLIPDEDDTEHMNDPKITVTNPPEEVSATLDALGYTADAPWTEVLKASELDQSTFANHIDFVKDVRRFSSGSNFTSVTDDNTNSAFTNFVGLRRPEHVPIGWDARQVPDVDETVLQRNRNLRW